MKNYQRIISWIAGLLTLCLTTFSFILSFETLTELAEENGIPVPPLFPLVVEAAVIVFSLVTLSRSMRGLPTKYNWTLIITSSLLAGFFNVAHAYPNMLSMFMAAMPSLFLLLSFESFLSLLKHSLSDESPKDDVTHSLILDIKNLNQKLTESAQKIQQLDNENVGLKERCKMLEDKIKEKSIVTKLQHNNSKKQVDKVEQRQQKVLKMLEDGKTQEEIANKLNVSGMTILRDVRQLNGKVKPT